MPSLWAFALVLLVQQSGAGAAPTDPRALLRQAQLAVEGDSVPAVRRRWSRALNRDSTDRGALLMLGALALLTYDYPEADARLARVVAWRGDDALADYARIEQGASLAARARFREAADAYTLALAGAERRGDRVALAEALLGLAQPRSRLAPPSEVLPLLDRAADMTHGDPVLEAGVRCQRAALWSRLGRPGARELADSGAALARGAGDLRLEGRCLHVVAQTLVARGDMGAGAEALGRAAALFRQSRDGASLAATLQWRGYLHVTLGHYGTARDVLTAAVAEGERAQAMSPVGWALINLGQIGLGVGDQDAAARDLTRAAALLEQQGDEWGMVTALGMLGGLARATGDLKGARDAYQRTLAWADRTGEVRTQFATHNSLASLAAQTGDWDGATRELEAARAVARAFGMTGWEGSLHYGTGLLALRRGDLATAERELRAYEAVTDTTQRDIRYRTRALLAEVYLARGETARGEAEITSASKELDDWRTLLPDGDLRIRAFQYVDYGADPDLGVATVISALARAGRAGTAFELAERRRSRDLTDRIYRAQAVTALTPAAQTPPVFGGARGGARTVVSDDSTALLEYVTGRGGEPTTLFIVTRAGIVSRRLEPIDSLDGAVRRLLTLLESGGDARALGARLGTALLEPALPALSTGITRLIIVPDDVLARLPFDALVLADGRYVIERFAVGMAPSAAAVLAIRARPPNDRAPRLLAFGDPRFAARAGDTAVDAGTATYRSAFDQAGGLGRLPASAREVRNVARYAADAEVRLRDRASEAFLRAAPLNSFRILHFATHALVDEQAVTRTALALAPGGGHDGFVGPGDLAGLPLRADLVVLSACRTARGELVGGEGVQGLTAPLLQAGARSVVATGWRIADASAGRLVDALYRELALGNPVATALRAAKLEALRAGAPAGEWAAFMVVGDPLTLVPVVMPAGTGIPWTWLIGVAVVVLALSVYRLTRKRRGTAPA
jgi:tetratricopeptide (TPR) repeat protein